MGDINIHETGPEDKASVAVTHDQIRREMDRLREIYPVVRLLDSDNIDEEQFCLLCGNGCICMRKVCEEVLRDGGHQTHSLRMGDEQHLANVRYVEVDGKKSVLLYAQPIDAESLTGLSDELLYRDALSGAYNRRFYEDNLRTQHMYAGIALLDLDDFKLVNDMLGHHAGDVALKAAVAAVNSCIRGTDMLVRYGGDEFVLVLPGIGEDDFSRKLRAITDKLAETAVPGYEKLGLSVSVGGALSEGRTVEETVRQADTLMYKAKTLKNAVVTETDDIEAEAVRKPLLLVVDDSEMNRVILSEMLKDQYDIIEADSGEAGISCLERYGDGVSIVLLDIVMPGADGFDVLSRMSRSGWIDDIPVIMISSEESDDMVLRAYELGASDYISRPFDARIVRQRVGNIMRLYAKQRRLSSMLAQQFYERERDSRLLVDIMGGAMELRNGESGPHVKHVRKLTEMVLEHLVRKTDRYHVSSRERATISAASTLHDLGKLSIPDYVLNKPGRLTPEEFEVMKTHTTIGANLLESMTQYRDSALVQAARDICRWHHERWDGNGYPDGLKGDEIPISAQVVSIVDVYDALTSDRVYKKAIPHEEAMQMILNGECGTFNPLLISCLIDLQERILAEKDDEGIPPPLSRLTNNETVTATEQD